MKQTRVGSDNPQRIEDFCKYDAWEDVLIIHGIRYARSLFEHLGVGPIGSVIRIVSRADGVVTLQKIERSDGEASA